MRSLNLSLDLQKFTAKPSNKEVPNISKRIAQQAINLELKTFAEAIAIHGQTWCPSVFAVAPDTGKPERRNTLFKQAQVIGLDFDSGIELEEIRTRSRSQNLFPNIIHESFSSTPALRKYRVVYVLTQAITNQRDFVCRVRRLLEFFPEADKATKDPARLFYGSNKGIAFFDAEARNEVKPIELSFNPVEGSIASLSPFQQAQDWGDKESSLQLFKSLPTSQKNFIARQFGISYQRIQALSWDNPLETGYQVIKEETIRLAGIHGVTGWLIHREFSQAAKKNRKFFSRWQYNLESVILQNYNWKINRPDILENGKYKLVSSF
ncbi:MAG: hypothetical protein ACRC80_38195 [Waterburya sp.]